jgi:predicted NBD/HSP70 family sugar kinase
VLTGKSRAAQNEARDNEIKYHKDPAKKADFYHVGVELCSPHLRLAALPVGAQPTLEPADAFQRTGFYVAGNYEWDFAPVSGLSGFTIAEEHIATVSRVLQRFLDEQEIETAQVARLRVGGVVTFNQNGLVVRANTDALRDRLEHDFADIPNMGIGSRIQGAVMVERRFGAGEEIRPSDSILYARISENLNIGADPGNWAADGIFARGTRHSRINRELLEQLGPEFIDGSYVATLPRTCPTCGRDCLHSIASGVGILELAAESPAAVEAAADAASFGGWRFAEDLGARLNVNGTVIDSGAVFRAAATDETCQRLVLQAGVALGIAISERIMDFDVFDPDLVVIGGTVAFSTVDEYRQLLETRRTIDGVMQRTLQHLRGRYLPVTRSRFAGYTGLLGMTAIEDTQP